MRLFVFSVNYICNMGVYVFVCTLGGEGGVGGGTRYKFLASDQRVLTQGKLFHHFKLQINPFHTKMSNGKPTSKMSFAESFVNPFVKVISVSGQNVA